MAAVSDTSPLLNLAIVHQLHLLKAQFGVIEIPQGVLDELCLSSDLPGNGDLRSALHDGWIRLRPVARRALLPARLGRGESEAISLAMESRASVLLLDDRDARVCARHLGLNCFGLLRVLIEAKRLGSLPKLAPLLKELDDKAGFYLREEVVAAVLKEVGEESTA